MNKLTRLKILEVQLNASQELISSVSKGQFVCPKDSDFHYIYSYLHALIEYVDGLIRSFDE